ncbi:GNAT family N-acetyltransferase [Erythrobacter alti]|uniref:GNAT family N-acetyltransferase n=1 Tax=Erythrobacter alti TaxID=1896145 RepID=UPI0030F469CA
MTFHIRHFSKADSAAFSALNRRWIEAEFDFEESDDAQLANPETSIIAKGGLIAIAEDGQSVIGCGALIPPHHEPDDGRTWIELVKFATDPAAQGKGVGGAVLDWLCDRASERGFDAIWLETNDRLQAATRLYERKSFRRLAPDEVWPTPYARCNLQMVKLIGNTE